MTQASCSDSRPAIAFFVPTLGMGGAERQALALACQLDRRRWRVLLIQARSDRSEYGDDLKDVTRITLGGSSAVQIAWKLDQCLAAHRVHILQAYLLSAQSAALLVRVLRWPGRLIVSVRDALPVLRHEALAATAAGGFVYGCSWWIDRYIFNSTRAAAAKSVLVPRGKSTIIYNGIDTVRFHPDREARARLRSLLDATPDARIVGIVANLSNYKDYPNFVEAARLVARQDSTVRFVSIGDDRLSDGDAIRRQVDGAGLRERLRFLGSRTDVESLVPGFDLGCLSSVTESFPNALAEAMACEVPCVTTDVGDAAEIVSGTGIVVPRQNPGQLANALLSALAWTSAEWTARAHAARARIVAHFSLERMLEAHEELYLRLLRADRGDRTIVHV